MLSVIPDTWNSAAKMEKGGNAPKLDVLLAKGNLLNNGQHSEFHALSQSSGIEIYFSIYLKENKINFVKTVNFLLIP